MSLTVVSFLLNIAFASNNIGIEGDVPPQPMTKKPQMSTRMRALEIQDGKIPRYLVPIKYSKHEKNVCRGKYYDENGEIYRLGEVFLILQQEKASRDSMVKSLDKLQLGYSIQTIGLYTVWLYGIGIPIYGAGWWIYAKGMPDCKQALLDFNSRKI